MRIGRKQKIVVRFAYLVLMVCCIALAYTEQSYSLLVAENAFFWETPYKNKEETYKPETIQVLATVKILELADKRRELAAALRAYYVGQGSAEECERLIDETQNLMKETTKSLDI
ncbi:MAG: hypothetical protein RR051_02715 [Clostridiales bacterium]